MYKLLLKFGIIFSIFGILPLKTFAQKICNLQFSVYDFKGDETSEQFPVHDSKVKMVNTKTKKSLKITKNNEFPLIADAPEGNYEISFSKTGFQTTLNSYTLDCSFTNSQNTVEEIMFLWKGETKQIIKYWGSLFKGKVSTDYRGSLTVQGSANEKTNESEIDKSNVLNGRGISIVKPEYPPAARAVRARGKVEVQVTINELGYVIAAKAISGHPLLQVAAVNAANKSRFSMTVLQGMPVKVTGIIVYNFNPN